MNDNHSSLTEQVLIPEDQVWDRLPSIVVLYKAIPDAKFREYLKKNVRNKYINKTSLKIKLYIFSFFHVYFLWHILNRGRNKNTNNYVDIFIWSSAILVVDLDYSISGGRGRDCKVVGFATTFAISVYRY
jgi:hypothetical protein